MKENYFKWALFFSQVIAHLSIIPMIMYGSWYHWLIGFFVYFITGCFGMTMTFHRLLSHKSWNAPKWFHYFGSLAGFYGLTGSTIGWVAIHRQHHHHTDAQKGARDTNACDCVHERKGKERKRSKQSHDVLLRLDNFCRKVLCRFLIPSCCILGLLFWFGLLPFSIH